MADEDLKPNDQRLPEFRDSNRESLRQKLLSKAPIHLELEQWKLEDLISRTLEIRGADDPLCQQILDGKSPRDRAASLVKSTKIHDVRYRTKLADGGANSINDSSDPMIQLARIVDPEMRRITEIRDELNELESQAYGKIADAMFALKGTSIYPDATFSLRLAYGVVRGYEEDGGVVPAWTTMEGAFEHETAPRWQRTLETSQIMASLER